MKTWLVFITLGLLVAAPAMAQWVEQGDAGDLPTTAQIPIGTGLLTTITGTITTMIMGTTTTIMTITTMTTITTTMIIRMARRRAEGAQAA